MIRYTKIWTLITLISLTIVTISTAVAFAYNSRDEIITTINVGYGENALQYIKEPGTGEISGPESFSLKSDGGFYLLDTARKRVMSFNSNGENDEIYKIPDDFTAAKISTGLNDQLYLSDTSKATIGIFDRKKMLTKYQSKCVFMVFAAEMKRILRCHPNLHIIVVLPVPKWPLPEMISFFIILRSVSINKIQGGSN